MSSEPPIPTKREVLQEQFGTTDHDECLSIIRETEVLFYSAAKESENVKNTGLFPYYDPGPLPAPIPTPSEMYSARAAAVSIYTGRYTQSWRVGPYHVRAGILPLLFKEAANIIYLNQRSDIAPKLYAAFESDEVDVLRTGWGRIKYYYVVTEFFEGETLLHVMDRLNIRQEQDRLVLEKIGHLLGMGLKKLRNIPPDDPKHFGGINGQGYGRCYTFRHSKGPDYENYGPFDNYETMVDRMIWAAMVKNALSSSTWDWGIVAAEIFRDARRTLLDSATEEDRKPVLTHFAIKERNILVQLVRNIEGKIIDVEKVTLTGWKRLCWMPSWYEVGWLQRGSRPRPLQFASWMPIVQKALDEIKPANMELVDFFEICVSEGVFPREAW